MELILHLISAFGSMGYATYLFVYPSKSKLFISGALVFFTLASGFYLVLRKPTHIVEACAMGLAYLGFVALATFSAQRKLAFARSRG